MPRRDSTDSSSDRSSDYKRKSKKRKRRSSSSSSGDSDKRYHHKSSRSTSSSRSRSRERSHRRRSRSHSASRERSRRHRSSRSSSRECSHKQWSRSSSRDRSHKHRSRSPRKRGSRHSSRSSHHRIRSRPKNKKTKSRSSSRSDSHSRSSRKSSRKSRSTSHSPRRKKSNSQGSKMREDDVIKLKLQQALKAAATADAELREKGLLAEQMAQKAASSNSTPSVADQVKRAQIIEEINAPTFTQQSFTSSTSAKQEKSVDSAGDIHTAAIFGNSTVSLSTNDTSACINNTAATTKAMREIWKNNPEKLAHETLFEDVAVKTERWKKKLLALRRRKMNGEHVM